MALTIDYKFTLPINTLKRDVTVKKSIKKYSSLKSYGLVFFVMLKSSLSSFYPHYNVPFPFYAMSSCTEIEDNTCAT